MNPLAESTGEMYVIKRNGEREEVSFDKITKRLKALKERNPPLNIDVLPVAQKVVSGIYRGVKTSELDEFAAETAVAMTTKHLDYGTLASRLVISNLHKLTPSTFREALELISAGTKDKIPNNGDAGLLDQKVLSTVREHADEIEKHIDYNKDYTYDYFGMRTLIRAYLLSVKLPSKEKKIVERPQHMLMRVALGVRPDSLEEAFKLYDVLSERWMTLATPTLFNAGTHRPQMSSCFLIDMVDDSIEGIYDTLKECAIISKNAGGIGCTTHKIRSRGSRIHGTGGNSNGLVPMLRNFNDTARYVDQCFTPETLMHTAMGVECISDVKEGALVYGASGQLLRVNKVLEHQYSGEILVITHTGGERAHSGTRVTPEHQVLILKGQGASLSLREIKNRIANESCCPEMVDACDIAVGDYACFPNNIDAFGGLPLESTSGFTHGKYSYFQITEIASETYAGSVYDFEIADEHTYITDLSSVHNGGGKRKGAFAMYLEPWHPDLLDFLELKKNHGKEETRARDLFYALWVSDLFMKRMSAGEDWSFFDPNECRGLYDSWGDEFEELYTRYEREGKAVHTMPARLVIDKIIESQIETGTPYMLYKDACNRKSNQQNLGTIKSSNLCVAPYTRILTRQGYQVISELQDQKVEVWNGFEWSEVTIRQTAENKELVRVKLSNGAQLDCTPEHRFHIQGEGKTEVVPAGDLLSGYKLISHDLPKVDDIDMKNSDIIRIMSSVEGSSPFEKTQSESLQDLQKLMLDLQTLGFWSRIYDNREDPSFDASKDSTFVLATDINGDDYHRELEDVRVISVEPIDGQHDTFCFTEPKRHLGMFEGVITGQCAEIVEYSSPEETAVCNLASIALPKFVIEKDNNYSYDFEKLSEIAAFTAESLNAVIDENFYPTKKTRVSNMRHRPIGIGVQGLADVFCMMKLPFTSLEAKKLNKEIFEAIYYGAVTASCRLAEKHGVYPSYRENGGCPASRGQLQFDLWNVTPSSRFDWASLKERISQHGLRNSLLCALMPTASTSQILGNNECFEPFTSNIYVRRTLSGEFVVLNKHLVRDLNELGLWNEQMRRQIIATRGSVQNFPEIPDMLKEVYRTVWEIPQSDLIQMAADRGPFIDQSQSMNVFIGHPTYEKMRAMHLTAWEAGLKTGMYYLRSQPAAHAQQFTVSKEMRESVKDLENSNKKSKKLNASLSNMTAEDEVEIAGEVCRMEEGCLICSS